MALVATAAGESAASVRRSQKPARSGAVVRRLVVVNARSTKPMAPVKIELVPGAAAGLGRQRVQIVVQPGVEAERVVVTVRAIEGVSVVAGRRTWTASGSQGAASAEELILGASGRGQRRVVVSARLILAGERQMTGIREFVLNPEGPAAAAVSTSGARKVRGQGGEQIIEIPAGP